MANNESDKETTENVDKRLKLILLGEVFTGKTSLINIYIKDKFNQNESSTVSPSFYTKLINIKNKKYIINIWDTAGQEQFRSMNKIFIKDSDIILFVYDITRKSTLEELSFWIKYVETCIGKNMAIYAVIGNKLDLYDKEDELKENNIKYDMVSTQEGKKFADEIGAEFLETSAKLNAPGLVNLINKLIIEYSNKFEVDIENEKKEQVELKTPNDKKKKKCC